MAKIHEAEAYVQVEDNTERTISFELSESQVIDALFTWMRLHNLVLPSQDPGDYDINVHFYDGTARKYVSFIHRTRN